MTTSGVYDLAFTLNETLSEAFDILGQGVDGETLSGSAFTRGKRSANLMLKEWQTQGIHLWTFTEATLFLEVGRAKYDFRDSDVRVVNEFFETNTTLDTVANALSFTVETDTDIQTSDIIGIIQDDNNLFWSTVFGVAGDVVVINDQIPLATLSGAQVYNYRPASSTNTVLIPVSKILDVRRKETTDYEIPIIFESREDYFNLPNKNQTGTAIQAYYSRQDIAGEVGGIMYLWSAPDSSVPIVNFTYERKIQILVNDTDIIDIPDFAQEAFIYGLAKRLMPKYGGITPQKVQWITAEADRKLQDMLSYDQAVYPINLDLGMNR